MAVRGSSAVRGAGAADHRFDLGQGRSVPTAGPVNLRPDGASQIRGQTAELRRHRQGLELIRVRQRGSLFAEARPDLPQQVEP